MTEPSTASARHLHRGLGMWSAIALVVSNMIGTGIFTSTGFMAGDLGSAAIILLAWLVGAAFAFCGALAYLELAINHPQSGGEYVYMGYLLDSGYAKM